MKISIIGDCHLNKVLYGNIEDGIPNVPFRTADFMNAFSTIVEKNIVDIRPDLIVIAGDIYDNYNPNNDVRAFFHEQIKKLQDENIPVLILVGNHDICSKNHALKPLKSLNIKTLKVIDETTITSFKGKVLLLFPHTMDVERNEISMKEKLHQFIEEVNKKKQENGWKSEDMLFFGHFPVHGAVLKESKASQFKYSSSSSIDTKDIDNIGASYVFLGDFHKHQYLKTEACTALYTGSIELTDISEVDHQKGFIVWDSEAENKIRFIEYKNARPMLSFRGSLLEIKDSINAVLTKKFNKRPIVEIKFKGTSKEYFDFSREFDGLKKVLKTNINPIHIYDSSEIINAESKNEVDMIEIEDDIVKSGSKVIREEIEKMIKEEVSDEDEQKLLILEAKGYLE